MSADPLFSAAMTPAASGAGITFGVTPILRASSRTRSGTGPVVSPLAALTRPCTGLLPRNTPRRVPVGASVDADGDPGDCAATGRTSEPRSTAIERRMGESYQLREVAVRRLSRPIVLGSATIAIGREHGFSCRRVP